MIRVGVVSVQGDVSEHVRAIERGLAAMGERGSVVPVRRREHIDALDGLVIPGGESTTIWRCMRSTGMTERLAPFVEGGGSVMGTCAGAILLASSGDEQVTRPSIELLGLMEMEVARNAFGRQRESFETDVWVEGMEGAFPGVFIRAPAIRRVWGGCRVVGRAGDEIVMAEQSRMLALTFHPELTDDPRLHMRFLKMMI